MRGSPPPPFSSRPFSWGRRTPKGAGLSSRGAATYAGARGRISLDKGCALGASWAVQVKHDGVYVELTTNDRGEIFECYSRAGRRVETDLLGLRTGVPHSRLVGELTAMTERGQEEVDRLGYQRCYLFDALLLEGRRLTSEPYRLRRDALMRAAAREWAKPGHGYDWVTDSLGRSHDVQTGRYRKRIPQGWRRLPVVEQRPAFQAEELWADHVASGAHEGLVFVRLDAPVGARSAKRKCKPVDDIDAVVVSQGNRAAMVETTHGQFAVGTGKISYLPGTVVTIRYEGWYTTGLPRFPRIVRTRPDLAAPSHCCDTVGLSLVCPQES